MFLHIWIFFVGNIPRGFGIFEHLPQFWHIWFLSLQNRLNCHQQPKFVTRYIFCSSQRNRKKKDKLIFWPFFHIFETLHCRIKVQFERGLKIKFLEYLFQSITWMSNYQSVPWTHSFQNMYNTYMCKMHLKGEKWR